MRTRYRAALAAEGLRLDPACCQTCRASPPDKRNQARRFITRVDALYDRRINLIVGAAAAPGELYPAGEGAFEFGARSAGW